MKKSPGPKKPAGTTRKPVTSKAVPQPAALMSRLPGRGNLYVVLSLLVFGLVLYGNTIFNKYAIDDNLVVSNELVEKGLKAIPEIFSTHYFSQEGNVGSSSADYRPVVKATFALEHQLWGKKPGRSHLINILLYVALSVLLFYILKRLLYNYNILFPYLVTLVFMAHPVHTEVVASLKNRDEMMAFLCGLGTLWSILNYADTKKIRYLALAPLLFLTGYLCKSSILPFLILIPLVLVFFNRMPVKKVAPVFIVLLVVALIAQMGPNLFLPSAERIKSYIENPPLS